MASPRAFLMSLFNTAVASAMPENCMRRWLPDRPAGRPIVVGAGKAAASMALELERQWGGPLEGIVITPYGHGVRCQHIEVVEAAHPLPDDAGETAARRVLEQVSGLSADDTVVCLISGGGSSLLSLPAPGVSLGEKRRITLELLKSGAPIHEINGVRKKLSAIKGGRLAAAAHPAHVLTLIISDVPGNNPTNVASGPTLVDDASAQDALSTLTRYNIALPASIRQTIETARPATLGETDVRILATSDDALIAASKEAMAAEVTAYSLGDLNGGAKSLALEHAALAHQIAKGNGPIRPPCVVLSGGEATVKVRGGGRGGRNGEYGLSLAVALDGHPHIHALACDTDGIDGSGDNAGCLVTPTTLSRAAAAGLDAQAVLESNDSHAFFAGIGDLITTGPTRTNVNDFRAILIEAD